MKIAVVGETTELAKARADTLWPGLSWKEPTLGKNGDLTVRVTSWTSSLPGKWDQVLLMNYREQAPERIENLRKQLSAGGAFIYE